MKRFSVILAYTWILCLAFLSIFGIVKFEGILTMSLIMALFVAALASIHLSQDNKIRNLEQRVNELETHLKGEASETNNHEQENK